MRKIILILSILAIVISSCGRRQSIFNRPEVPSSGRWETVWIDPVPIYSDSLFTIIGSNRIDSVYVDNADPYDTPPISVIFEVVEAGCVVSIDIVENNDEVVEPLFLQLFSRGLYKFTFQPEKWSELPSASSSYQLYINACIKKYRVPLLIPSRTP